MAWFGVVESRRRLATLAALGVAVLLVVQFFSNLLAAPRAAAAQNTAIKVATQGTIVRATSSTNPLPGQQIFVNDTALVKFTWDATNAKPKPGDSFTIKLPTTGAGDSETAVAFENRERSTFPIKDAKGNVLGSCVVSKFVATCTLGEEVKGKTDIKGSLSLMLTAVKDAADAQLKFNLNGTAAAIATNNKGGVKARAITPLPKYTWTKAATPLGQDSKTVQWLIRFSGAQIIDKVADPTNWTITDVLGSGQKFSTDMKRYLLQRTAYTDDKGNRVEVPAAQRALDYATPGATKGFELTVDPAKGTFRIKGKLDPKAHYQILYTTDITSANGMVERGFVYKNTAELALKDGTKKIASAERSYVDNVNASIELKEGFGTFNITKRVAGKASSSVPNGQKFTVSVAWKLPEGKSLKDYPMWTAPANPAKMEVTVGQKSDFVEQFPTGTVVTLTEDVATANPVTPAIKWGTPKFIAASGLSLSKEDSTATFVIESKVNRPLVLSNEAQFATSKFAVKKIVEGDDKAAFTKHQFTFAYECSDGIKGSLKVKGDGVAVASTTDHKPGTTCTITEDPKSADRPGYTWKAPEKQVVTIVEESTVSATFTNTYQAKTVSFWVSKRVTGDNAQKFSQQHYIFTYTCSDKQSGTVKVKGDGSAIEVATRHRPGVECTVTEDVASAKRFAYKLGSPAPLTFTLDEGEIELAFVNAYKKASARPTVLPRTGASGALTGATALLTVLGGLMFIHRRKSN